MASPLDNSRASTLAGSRRSSTTGTAARSPQAPAHEPGAQSDQEDREQASSRQEQEPQQPQQHQQQQHQQQQQQQQQASPGDRSRYGHRGSRAGYFPAQVRRLPFDMATYAHFMLMHTKHQMDAVPDAAPPPAHLSIAGLPQGLGTHSAGHWDRHNSHPNSSSRASTADTANGISN